jgi:hypothetical protein
MVVVVDDIVTEGLPQQGRAVQQTCRLAQLG